MLAKKLLVISLAIAMLGSVGMALAQSDESKSTTENGKSKTISQRLDRFGKSIFGGLLSTEKPKPRVNPKPSALATPQLDDRPAPRKPAPRDVVRDEPITSRSGDILRRPSRPGAVAAPDLTPETAELTPENAPLTVRRQVKETPRAETQRAEPQEPEPQRAEVQRAEVQKREPQGVEAPSTAGPSLHERLSGYRDSVFDSDDLGIFYVVETINYCNETVLLPFHASVSIVVALWVLASVVCQQLLENRRWSFAARYVWGTVDSVALFTVLLLGNSAASSLVVGYPLVIVASGLWFRVRFVWYMTLLSLLSYGLLVVHLYVWRPDLNEGVYAGFDRHVIFAVGLMVLGSVVAYLVERVRVLSSFYGRPL